MDYIYNENVWLRQMNTVSNPGRDLFALDLRYNTPGSSDALTAGARCNGNISEMRRDAGHPKEGARLVSVRSSCAPKE